MKILHLETGTHVYGGALQALLLVEGLEARGVENLLVVPEGSEVGAEALRRGLPVHLLPIAGEADILFPLRFRRLINSTKPDLVHLHSRRGADTLGGLGALSTGVPIVLTRRVDNPEPSWAVGVKYRLYDRVVTISEAIRDVLLSQGVDPRKLRCVLSALDPSPFENPRSRGAFLEEFGLDQDHRVVGMAAQFIERKGHDVLLRAIPLILQDHPRTGFLLFGQGPRHSEVSRKVAEAGLGESVLLPGFRKDLPSLLPCLDILVHPATMEGLGIILLQAAASGLPVVAAAAGGIPEAVEDGKTGFLVPPGNPTALAGAVATLLADPQKGRSMGEAGRKLVRERFSIQSMVEGNLGVYREILAEPPSQT